MAALKDQGFIRQENGRSTIIIDLTKVLDQNQDKMRIDVAAEILCE